MFPSATRYSKFHILDGEFPVSCPYNSSHTIAHSKFLKHLMKCRQNYEITLCSKKAPLVKVSCKYNFLHQVYPPEILCHESTCSDKYKAFLDFLAVRYHDKIEGICKGTYPTLKDLRENFKSMIEKLKGNEGQALFNSSCGINFDNLPKSLIIAIKDRPKVQVVPLDSPVPSEAEEKMAKKIAKDRMNTSRYDQSEGREHRISSRQRIANMKTNVIFEENEAEPEEDSAEYYASNSLRPTYSYMTSWQKSTAPTLFFPPGLTKRQRKKYGEYNAQRLHVNGLKFD